MSSCFEKPRHSLRTRVVALDSHVLAVAKEGSVKDWSAYIGAVEGNNHDVECQGVFESGSKLPYAVARVLFPDFDCDFKWRP